MLLSSRCRQRGVGFAVGGVVAEHGPSDVDAAAGDGDEGLLVRLALCAFPVVERSRGGTGFEAGEGGEVAGSEESAVEPSWPV